jgi:hypothetical protein
MSNGYRVALVTILVFVLLVFTAMNATQDAVAVLAPLAFLILYGGLSFSAYSVTREKGYSAMVGVAVGLASLLGLLVITLIPASPGAEQESKP